MLYVCAMHKHDYNTTENIKMRASKCEIISSKGSIDSVWSRTIHVRAALWIAKAAEQGVKDAQFFLGTTSGSGHEHVAARIRRCSS